MRWTDFKFIPKKCVLKNILKNNACALWSRAAMHDIGATTVTFYYQLRKIDRKHIDFLFSFKKKVANV